MYLITEKQVVGEVYEVVALYDLMSIIMICLGSKKDERYTGLLKLLDAWVSKHSIDEKGAVLQSEFNTALSARLLEKEVNMSNYSEFVWIRGIKRGITKGRKDGIKGQSRVSRQFDGEFEAND
jgi:hypothetical protein